MPARPSCFIWRWLVGSPSHRQPDLRRLLEPGITTSWAVLDMAMVRQAISSGQGSRPSARDLGLVREIPTTLNLPTLLDVDPSAASGRSIDASAPLRLLRPRRTEDVR